MKYPAIANDAFPRTVTSNFKKYKINTNKTFKEYCYPTKMELQLPQQFVGQFINPSTPYKGLMIYHKIGSGKTCSGITIAEQWKGKRKIVVLVPASLIGNFRKEIRDVCGNGYVTKAERAILDKYNQFDPQYKAAMKVIDKKIDKHYTIMSYNRYIALVQKKKMSLKDTLLIIDEVQNMVSEHGSYYRLLKQSIDNAPNDLRVVLLTATPMFDKPMELALTMNLLKLPKPIPIGTQFNQQFLTQHTVNNTMEYRSQNLELLKRYLLGYVSYFQGAPQYTFPTHDIHFVRASMSNYQYRCYRTVIMKEKSFNTTDIMALPNNFFIGPRMISNIAFPKRLVGRAGYLALKKKHLLMKNIKTYSNKFYKILRKVKQATGPVFIYSNFKEYGGILSLLKVFQANGFKDYKTKGEGSKRFAVWSGDESLQYREEIKFAYNKPKNKDGSTLKVLFGSPAIKEGVSLLRVSQVHILEPHWNWSRLDQVMGRALRYCSHKDLPRVDRHVDIYIYLSTHPKDPLTIDRHIINMAKSKKKIIGEFETALKEAAVDCRLNEKANKGDQVECMVK